MAKIGLFYGTTSGATEYVAERIKEAFDQAVEPDIVALHDISQSKIEDMYEYEKLIIGAPTYDVGELQDDWYFIYDDLEHAVLIGIQVAIYGLGDQYGYPDTFQDAIGILGRRLRDDCDAELVGYWPTEGYEFEGSRGIEDGQFMGLALDEDNQPGLTDERIEQWVAQLVEEFELKPAAAPA